MMSTFGKRTIVCSGCGCIHTVTYSHGYVFADAVAIHVRLVSHEGASVQLILSPSVSLEHLPEPHQRDRRRMPTLAAKVSARLDALRNDENERAALEARVADYEAEARAQRTEERAAAAADIVAVPAHRPAPSSTDESALDLDAMSRDVTPRARPSVTRPWSGQQRSGRPRPQSAVAFRPISPTLGTARSWSALDTVSVDADGDPVGGCAFPLTSFKLCLKSSVPSSAAADVVTFATACRRESVAQHGAAAAVHIWLLRVRGRPAQGVC